MSESKDQLRQECERRAEKALPCDSDCFRMFSDKSKAHHWPSCAAFHREPVADALEEAIRPIYAALDGMYGQVMQAREGFGIYTNSKTMEHALEVTVAALAPYCATPQAEPEEPRK